MVTSRPGQLRATVSSRFSSPTRCQPWRPRGTDGTARQQDGSACPYRVLAREVLGSVSGGSWHSLHEYTARVHVLGTKTYMLVI